MSDGIELTDFLGTGTKLLMKTGAIEKLILSLSEEERKNFFSAMKSTLCFKCGRAGNPPNCNCQRTKKR